MSASSEIAVRVLAPEVAAATPVREVGRSWSGGTAFGLEAPMPLLGGDALTAGWAESALGLGWNGALLARVGAACLEQRSAGRRWFRMPPTMLTGPPGAGRRHVARRLAAAVGVPHVPIDLGADGGAAALGAPARGPTPARFSGLALAIASCGCANPLIDVSGLELVAGEIAERVVRAADPATSVFDDEALGVTLELSEASWLFQLPPTIEPPPALATFASTIALVPPSGAEEEELAWIEALAEVAVDRGLGGACDALPAWDPAGDRYWGRGITAGERRRLAETAFDEVYGRY